MLILFSLELLIHQAITIPPRLPSCNPDKEKLFLVVAVLDVGLPTLPRGAVKPFEVSNMS